MKALLTTVESGNSKKIETATRKAKQAAAENLNAEGYRAFCRHLLKQQGLLRHRK
jgi:hypothetical protein